MPEKWVYGYQMTNRFIIRVSEKFNLPWKTDCGIAFLSAQIHVRNKSGIPLRMECLSYRGRLTTVIVFVEDHLKRLHALDYSDEEIDRVRAALELPEGTKPKWYEYHGNYPEDTEFDSEDDIDWEDNCPPPPESMAETYAKKYVFVDLDESDRSDETEEMDGKAKEDKGGI